MQADRDLEVTDLLERTARQMDLSALQGETGQVHGLGDIGGADRTEQFALFTGLAHDLHRGAGHFLGACLGLGQCHRLDFLQLGTSYFKRSLVLLVGNRRLALRDQKVAAVTGTHLHQVAQVAEIAHLLKQNDFHCCFLLNSYFCAGLLSCNQFMQASINRDARRCKA